MIIIVAINSVANVQSSSGSLNGQQNADIGDIASAGSGHGYLVTTSGCAGVLSAA